MVGGEYVEQKRIIIIEYEIKAISFVSVKHKTEDDKNALSLPASSWSFVQFVRQ